MITGMIAEVETEKGLIKKTCWMCSHSKVCIHYHNNKKIIETIPEQLRPWKEDDVAVICRFFHLEEPET